jgi:hypothetical protein
MMMYNIMFEELEFELVVVMVMVAAFVTVFPFKDAETVRRTVPTEFPAVNVTVEPVVGLTLPRVLFKDQLNVVPAGQVAEHTAVAENV